MAQYSPAEVRMANERFLDLLDNPATKQAAVETAQTYTKYRVYEDGVTRRIQPPVTVGNEDLKPSVEHEDPVIICEMERDAPAATTVQFGELPDNMEIYGRRYEVALKRIQTVKFRKNVDLLRTYKYDLRQLFADSSLRMLTEEEDNSYFALVDALLGNAGDIVEFSGIAQFQEIPGSISRESLEDAFKIMPRTPSHLEVATVVLNNITVREIFKIGRDEMGGDYSQELFRTGKFNGDFMGVNWIATIKHNLVPDDVLYFFGHPDYLGKFFELEGPTAFVDKKYFDIEFFHSELLGITIANTNAIAKAKFVPG